MKKQKNQWTRHVRVLVTVLVMDGFLLGAMAGILNIKLGEGQKELEASGAVPKMVALTFDDGPHKQYTEKLLDGLQKRGVCATFFLMGKSIEGQEDLVKRMEVEGHLIGNHSYEHIQLTKASEEVACESIERTGLLIEEITGEKPGYLRPPYGDWNQELECKMELTTVFWTVDSLDWKLKNTEKIVSYVLPKVGDGDIVLMHDIFSTSVDEALEIVDQLLARGYTFVTVDELMID